MQNISSGQSYRSPSMPHRRMQTIGFHLHALGELRLCSDEGFYPALIDGNH
jgi:hypothetical protein